MREPFGVILAGGRGTRMGNVPKADIMLGRKSLLARCKDRLEPQSSGIVVVANASVQTQLPIIPDSLKGHLGPLAGILAGLEYAEQKGHDHIVSAAVDTPFFPCDLAPNLILAGLGHPLGFSIAATENGLHPTFGLWPAALIDPLRQFLNDGHRKARQFTQSHGAATASFPTTTPDAFFNVNTPENLADATQWI